jgi:hypothetical protein
MEHFRDPRHQSHRRTEFALELPSHATNTSFYHLNRRNAELVGETMRACVVAFFRPAFR